MGIFKRKSSVPEIMRASVLEEAETMGEIRHIEGLSNTGITTEEPAMQMREEIVKESILEKEPEKEPETAPEINYREVPVCLSQSQINSLVIENNLMLKQIVSSID